MPAPLLKTALVTGAGRRIGRELALELARSGWAVAIHYQSSRADADAVVAEITASGGHAAALRADLAVPGEVADLIPGTGAALGAPPTCLVNNASLFETDSALTLTMESWRQHLAVNLEAPVFLARALALALPTDSTANVVNIIDQRVLRLTPEFFSYTIAKSALWTATRTLAQALAPRIRVNAIGPGPVLASIHQSAAEFAIEAGSTPLGHGTTPDEIAAALRFILASPAMTGQMIVLDGGQHLEWRGMPPLTAAAPKPSAGDDRA